MSSTCCTVYERGAWRWIETTDEGVRIYSDAFQTQQEAEDAMCNAVITQMDAKKKSSGR
jgi:hypothetical protein